MPGASDIASGALTFSGGGGSGATGTYTVTGSVVTAISITTGGSGYSTAPTISFPASAPRVTVLVTIDEPDPLSSDRFGGKAAAPLFARIAEAAINELAITPTPGDRGCAGR